MKIGAMLGDLLRSLFRRPVTERYPFVKRAPPERLRGALRYDPANCSGCMLCMKDCPANALELITIDRKAKKFVMRYHADRCTFCAQCVASCRFKCLNMSNEQYELAALTKAPFTVHYGNESDIQALLDAVAPTNSAPTAKA
ncbi:MAG: 4Fe-4S dicluster domain-containing protein [Anaerolineae bacterium]|nr:4Fe-4S dicluster domain-containing protein [Thermoflexales bacterium]MDW8407351.1 4Fe-4S dicluster domain-containing protein [Anaerolineae bacterium]